MVCKVTFAFVDDCMDAVAFFKHSPFFFLYFLDIEGSPWQHEQPHSQPVEPVKLNGRSSIPNKKIAFKAQEVTTKESKESKCETTDVVQDVADWNNRQEADKSGEKRRLPKDALQIRDRATSSSTINKTDFANSSPPIETAKEDETSAESEKWGFRVPISGVASSYTAPADMQASKITWELAPLRRYVSAG
ncbi:hypothetical protein PHISCL_02813 [Aspergillus sclerotialis]|uniref:Uncharacterized protein n=1 Tax=Aspergillus sclerotialis TaxID=2070753 RepID=A0A3A2ZNP4_9EURO|nr:hypothetical protein PHISCL_02813 [Aspergillus sclerotialis]